MNPIKQYILDRKLLYAVKKDDVEMAFNALEQGANVNKIWPNGLLFESDGDILKSTFEYSDSKEMTDFLEERGGKEALWICAERNEPKRRARFLKNRAFLQKLKEKTRE